jgi:hypothetical protein
MSKGSILKAGRPSAGRSRAVSDLADKPALKRVNFDLSAAAHAKLKIYAARQGKSLKEVLTEFVASLPDE